MSCRSAAALFFDRTMRFRSDIFKYLLVLITTMDTKQINLKLSKSLLEAAQSYARNFGYRNIQELASESLREKVFEQNEFDENVTEEEAELIDQLIELSVQKGDVVSEEQLYKALRTRRANESPEGRDEI